MKPYVEQLHVSSHCFSVPCSTKPDVVQSGSGARPNRHGPSEGSQRAGAAALARIEQIPRPKIGTSQDAIRNQGEANHPIPTLLQSF